MLKNVAGTSNDSRMERIAAVLDPGPSSKVTATVFAAPATPGAENRAPAGGTGHLDGAATCGADLTVAAPEGAPVATTSSRIDATPTSAEQQTLMVAFCRDPAARVGGVVPKMCPVRCSNVAGDAVPVRPRIGNPREGAHASATTRSVALSRMAENPLARLA